MLVEGLLAQPGTFEGFALSQNRKLGEDTATLIKSEIAGNLPLLIQQRNDRIDTTYSFQEPKQKHGFRFRALFREETDEFGQHSTLRRVSFSTTEPTHEGRLVTHRLDITFTGPQFKRNGVLFSLETIDAPIPNDRGYSPQEDYVVTHTENGLVCAQKTQEMLERVAFYTSLYATEVTTPTV